MVDVRKYTSGVVMPDDLRDGPRRETIVNVYISDKHDVPVLVLESGSELFAWPNIGRVLVRAYGYETDDWRGHVIELSLGSYTDKKTGEAKDTILLKTISSRDGAATDDAQRIDPAKLPKPTAEKDLDDSVPF